MKLTRLALVGGPERSEKARAAVLEAAESLGLAEADRARVVEGVTRAVAAIGAPHEALLLCIGMPGGGPARVMAWIRSQGCAPLDQDAPELQALADELSIRDLPGGLVTTVLRWRVQDARPDARPDAVAGEAAEWAMQSLGFLERSLLAERRARAGADELLGVVAHSLRNPIGSMASAADLLQLAPGDPATLETAVGILARSSRAALRLIADLEQLHQIDAGTLHLAVHELRPSLLADLASEVARPLAMRRNVEIKVEKDGTQRFVLGDHDRLVQALGNLVVGAVEQSPEGKPVTMRARAEDSKIVFEIEDCGPHVPADAVPTLFDRMRKAGPRRRSSGAFGLAAARELIEAHGGAITCLSEPGACTVMRVTLPGA